jgi:ribosome-associated protein
MSYRINDQISIPDDEVKLQAIRAQGAGGQNVNKVSSAIHLRFDVRSSSLPDSIKERLLQSTDQRLTSDGVIVIKAQSHRSQEKNRSEAISRLRQLIVEVTKVRRKRVPTRPGRAARERRLESKKQRSSLKKLRSKDYD